MCYTSSISTKSIKSIYIELFAILLLNDFPIIIDIFHSLQSSPTKLNTFDHANVHIYLCGPASEPGAEVCSLRGERQ